VNYKIRETQRNQHQCTDFSKKKKKIQTNSKKNNTSSIKGKHLSDSRLLIRNCGDQRKWHNMIQVLNQNICQTKNLSSEKILENENETKVLQMKEKQRDYSKRIVRLKRNMEA
jgi:hypothetical protein